jgi:hypothetical protein
MKLKYTSPEIADYGDVREITAGVTGREFDDAIHQIGDFSFQHTTGACLNIPTHPCI